MDHLMDLVHGPPHGPGPWTTPWTTPNFQQEIASVNMKIHQRSGYEKKDYNFLARNRNDDPAGIRWINSDLIFFTYK